MQLKNEPHIFNGLQRDLSKSKTPSTYLYDANNIRITAREDGTLMSITNEKGPLAIPCDDIDALRGSYLGHCLLNNYLVIFTTNDDVDTITRIDLSTDPIEFKILFSGDLNFNIDNKIDAIGYFENENIQKVYWTDGINQPRVINIVKEYINHSNIIFDFSPELSLKERVDVETIYSNGSFPSGMIQYVFTYYNKYAQETGIFYTTPLYQIVHKNRGASPEEKVNISFRIEISNLDINFEYVRIYSIIRTSLNATPLVKKVVDLPTSTSQVDSGNLEKGHYITYTDTNEEGEDLDPTELLYKNGTTITAKTLEQKDGTLFLGNITLTHPTLTNIKVGDTSIKDYLKEYFTSNTGSSFNLICGKSTVPIKDNQFITDYILGTHVPSRGFKTREYYRLGLQFQYKTGSWSEPCWIGDKQYLYDNTDFTIQGPTVLSNGIVIPAFLAVFNKSSLDAVSALLDSGYKKVRPVFVEPRLQDRTILLQGIGCPVVYTTNNRYTSIPNENIKKNSGNLYAQSSWIFRTVPSSNAPFVEYNYPEYKIAYLKSIYSFYDAGYVVANPKYFESTEIMGDFSSVEMYQVDYSMYTIHSPDLIFNEDLYQTSFKEYNTRIVGNASFTTSYGVMDTATSSSTISKAGRGTIKIISKNEYGKPLVSALGYSDRLVDDLKEENALEYNDNIHNGSTYLWPVYMWHKNGSLNNDVNRPGRSAELLKKVVSNFRISPESTYFNTDNSQLDNYKLDAAIFNSDELDILKLRVEYPKTYEVDSVEGIYQGNVDTMVFPWMFDSENMFGHSEYQYFLSEDTGTAISLALSAKDTSKNDTNKKGSVFRWAIDNSNGTWGWGKADTENNDNVVLGDYVPELRTINEGIRIKYKSTPHIVVSYKTPYDVEDILIQNEGLPLLELSKTYNQDILYGGQTEEALYSNIWIPCGDAVDLRDIYKNINEGNNSTICFDRGDTYYKRFDCLKTYPFTREDTNQVVEMASFLCETRINLDGRYDRNKGLIDNTNISPINHNLFNPVYNQMDNFFTYRILDKDFHELNTFSNQVTWTKEKQPGSDTDSWTHITLASTLNVDGSKGQIQSLNTFKDSLYCFQDAGISTILFNSRVQIPTSDNVPIEITNSYKVDGYRYIVDGIGCSNKWTIKETPLGIYFIDSITNSLYYISDNINNITTSNNMNSWFNDTTINRLAYDVSNQDVYIISDDTTLCYSEILKQFTSFMSYGNISLLENYKGKSFFAENGIYNVWLFKMFSGNYNEFYNYETKSIEIHNYEYRPIYNIKIYTDPKVSTDPSNNEVTNTFTPESPIKIKFISGGTLSISLNNFVLDSHGEYIPIGNIHLDEIQLVYNKEKKYSEFSVTQNIYIAAGDDPNYSFWMGPMLNSMYGAIPFKCFGRFDKENIYISIEIDMLNTNLAQKITGTIGEEFNEGSDFEPEVIYTDELINAYKPWNISFITNGITSNAVSEDKIFTNIEYRMDMKNSSGEYEHNKSFDYIRVDNEYQDTGIVPLINTTNKSSNLKKKFRVWRIDIPRAIRIENGKQFSYKRDRIRNTWCNITLGINNDNTIQNTDSAELHDIVVQYYT